MKVSRDQLVAVGRLLSTPEGAKVDHVDVAGTEVSLQAARDAFEHEQQPGGAPAFVTKAIDKVEAKAETAQQVLMRNTVTRFLVEHIKPAEDLVEHEQVALHFEDGTVKQVDLSVTDTKLNRAMHDVAIGSGLLAFVPFVGSFGFAGTTLASALAAAGAKLSGHDDAARMLWRAAETNFFRLVGTSIPVAGNLVDALVIAMEAKARGDLVHPASVGDMLKA